MTVQCRVDLNVLEADEIRLEKGESKQVRSSTFPRPAKWASFPFRQMTEFLPPAGGMWIEGKRLGVYTSGGLERYKNFELCFLDNKYSNLYTPQTTIPSTQSGIPRPVSVS